MLTRCSELAHYYKGQFSVSSTLAAITWPLLCDQMRFVLLYDGSLAIDLLTLHPVVCLPPPSRSSFLCRTMSLTITGCSTTHTPISTVLSSNPYLACIGLISFCASRAFAHSTGPFYVSTCGANLSKWQFCHCTFDRFRFLSSQADSVLSAYTISVCH